MAPQTADPVSDIRRRHGYGDHYAMLGQEAIGELLREIDRLNRALTETHDAWTAETTKRLQAQHERDCAVEDVARLLRYLREGREALGSFETRQNEQWLAELDAVIGSHADVAQQRIIDRTVDELTAASEVASAFRQPGLLIDAAAGAGGADDVTTKCEHRNTSPGADYNEWCDDCGGLLPRSSDTRKTKHD